MTDVHNSTRNTILRAHFDSLISKTQSNDRPFIADAGLKGRGFLFRFLKISKMLGVRFFFDFTGVEGMSAFFDFTGVYNLCIRI